MIKVTSPRLLLCNHCQSALISERFIQRPRRHTWGQGVGSGEPGTLQRHFWRPGGVRRVGRSRPQAPPASLTAGKRVVVGSGLAPTRWLARKAAAVRRRRHATDLPGVGRPTLSPVCSFLPESGEIHRIPLCNPQRRPPLWWTLTCCSTALSTAVDTVAARVFHKLRTACG